MAGTVGGSAVLLRSNLYGSGSMAQRERAVLGFQCQNVRLQLEARRFGLLNARGSRHGAMVVAAAAAVAESESEVKNVQRLKAIYLEKAVPVLKEEFKYTNALQIPCVKKVVVNCGIGEAAQNAKALEATLRDLALITGQRAVTTRAKKAIAGFKLRAGVPVGITLTLRGDVMYSFLDRLLNLALPRTRDFQGVSQYSFDGKGNYTLGVPEQSVFPEIRFENVERAQGMDVSIITTAQTDSEGLKLLTLLGMPFKEGGSRPSSSSRKQAKMDYRSGKKRK